MCAGRLAASWSSALPAAVPALAQGETTSAIVGSVTDPTGAAIPGATVTVTNIENGLKRSVKTDDCRAVQLSATQARHVFGESGSGPLRGAAE